MTSPRRPDQSVCAPAEHPLRVTRATRGEEARSSRATSIRVVARVFVAAGDVHRLRLLVLLMDRPMSVGGLARATGLTVSLVSQQLRVLRDAELVTANREGREVVYEIIDPKMRRLLEASIRHACRSGRSG